MALDFIHGRHPALRVLQNPLRHCHKLVVQQDLPPAKTLDALHDTAVRRGIGVQTLPRNSLEKKFSLSGKPHQGVVVLADPYPYKSLEEILPAHFEPTAFWLLLDHLQDPHNIGAIVRSASLAGVQAIVLPRDRACEITSTVVKTSAGATELIDIVQVTNLNRTIDQLKEYGMLIVGLETGEGKTIYDIDYQQATGIVVGQENKGIARLTRGKCDELAEIPMHSALESLNVSVAAAVGMFEVVRQRHIVSR